VRGGCDRGCGRGRTSSRDDCTAVGAGGVDIGFGAVRGGRRFGGSRYHGGLGRGNSCGRRYGSDLRLVNCSGGRIARAATSLAATRTTGKHCQSS